MGRCYLEDGNLVQAAVTLASQVDVGSGDGKPLLELRQVLDAIHSTMRPVASDGTVVTLEGSDAGLETYEEGDGGVGGSGSHEGGPHDNLGPQVRNVAVFRRQTGEDRAREKAAQAERQRLAKMRRRPRSRKRRR